MTLEQAATAMYAAHDALQATDRNDDFDAYCEARSNYTVACEAYHEAYARRAATYVQTIRKA